MIKKVLALSLLAVGLAFAAEVNLGIRIGAPPPPRVVAVRPVAPGPDYIWVDGYWYPVEGHYRWHEGYWTRPPYAGARWSGPRHDGERFYNGYWEGEHGRVEHDHRSDRDRNRDHREERHEEHR
jgi:hypothetical protein